MADYTITNLDSRLKTYLETNGVEVLTKALFNSESAKYFQVQTGVTAEQPIITLSHWLMQVLVGLLPQVQTLSQTDFCHLNF